MRRLFVLKICGDRSVVNILLMLFAVQQRCQHRRKRRKRIWASKENK